MKRILNAFRQIKFKDLLAPFVFLILLIPSFIFRLINKGKHRKLWLVAEQGEARDNGYHFYKYVRTNHPTDYCFYAIKKDSAGYDKVAELGNVIKWGGLKHWLYYMSANLNISSQKSGNPCPIFWYVIHVTFGLYRNRVFLQHGITKDDSKWIYYKKTKFKYFVCGAKREYDFILGKFGYKEKNLLLTGFPRWDSLKDTSKSQEQKSILIMPTWRNWLGGDRNNILGIEEFKKTSFFKNWNTLLTDKEFIDYIEKNNIIVYFYPHIHMIRYINLFVPQSKNIKIISIDSDIQKFFNECSLMITDYSSVAFDFAYLGKPVFYYQFDYEEYRKKQLQKGYFDYIKDGFGIVSKHKDEIINRIIDLTDKDNRMIDCKKQKFFIFHDNNNSARLYKMLNRKTVLHVIYTLDNGGTQRYLINLLKYTNDDYRNIVVYYDGDNAWRKELSKLSIPVIKLDGNNNDRFCGIRSIIKNNKVDIVYSYSFYNSVYILFVALITGVKKRIVHSHRSSATKNINSVKALIARVVISTLATDKLACSDGAGKALFIGKNYHIVNNGVELERYSFDMKKRAMLRKKLHADDDCLLLGTIGHLDNNKNQIFMIRILEELIKKDTNCKLVIIGDGENETLLKKYIKDKALEKNVIMLGAIKSANEYYNAFDVFLLTSYSEGLPFVLIEAQINGLPVFVSSTVSAESRINPNVRFLDLRKGEEKWASCILYSDLERVSASKKMQEYSISKIIKRIGEFYEN